MCCVCLSEKSEEGGETYWNAEASDESDNLSDLDGDPVVCNNFLLTLCCIRRF